MESFITKDQSMKLNNWLLGVTPLGESNPVLWKPSVLTTFNNYDYAITITLKGSNKIRALEGKLEKQYLLFKKLISTIIYTYAKNYYFNFELHKCGVWLHAHGIIKVDAKNIIKIKRELFQEIEGEKIQRYMSYSRRIKIDKLHDIHNWYSYCKKDEEQMLLRHKLIKKVYRLTASEEKGVQERLVDEHNTEQNT